MLFSELEIVILTFSNITALLFVLVTKRLGLLGLLRVVLCVCVCVCLSFRMYIKNYHI